MFSRASRKHLTQTDRAIIVTRLLNRVEELPRKARRLLCHKSNRALNILQVSE